MMLEKRSAFMSTVCAVMLFSLIGLPNDFCLAQEEDPLELPPLQSVTLETASAEAIEVMIAKLFPEVMFSAERTSNTLYYRCDAKSRVEIEAFLIDADQRAKLKMKEQDEYLAGQTVEGAPQETTVIVELQQISPEDALIVISDLGINVRAAASGNSLILKTDDDGQKRELLALLQRIDVAPNRLDSDLLAGQKSTYKQRSEPISKEPQSVAEMAEAFRAKQAILRMQIELQREKLRMLEQRLEQRERIAKEYFSQLDVQEATTPANPARSSPRDEVQLLNVDPYMGINAASEDQASRKAIMGLLGSSPTGKVDGQIDVSGFSEAVQVDVGQASVYPTGKEIELPKPVQSEQEAALLICEFGGWYKLDDEGHIEEINMVYFEDESGERFENRIREEGFLICVPELNALKRLYLQGRQVTDQGMICVGQCENLTNFYVWDAAGLTDAGVKHLAGLSKLEQVHIGDAGITDASLRVLAELPSIKKLTLQKNEFSDKGLKALRKAKTLQEVWVGLGESQFSDSGIRELLGLENLKKLSFQHSPVSKKTVAAFESAGVELVNPILQD